MNINSPKIPSYTDLFLDLHLACSLIPKNSKNRIKDFLKKVNKGVYIIAIGGFPIRSGLNDRQEKFSCFNKFTLLISDINTEIKEALGLSGILTYTNRSNLSLDELGNLCIKRKHDWGYNWITFSLLFVGYDLESELAFTRDKRFFMSWPDFGSDGKLFAASGSIKDWVRFTSKHDDKSFNKNARVAMKDANILLERILP